MHDVMATLIGIRCRGGDKPLPTVAQIAATRGGVRQLLVRRQQLLDQGEDEGANAIGDELLLLLPLPRWRRWLMARAGAMG